eukprot:15166-Heterococcus_DN1.PRE.1
MNHRFDATLSPHTIYTEQQRCVPTAQAPDCGSLTCSKGETCTPYQFFYDPAGDSYNDEYYNCCPTSQVCGAGDDATCCPLTTTCDAKSGTCIAVVPKTCATGELWTDLFYDAKTYDSIVKPGCCPVAEVCGIANDLCCGPGILCVNDASFGVAFCAPQTRPLPGSKQAVRYSQ